MPEKSIKEMTEAEKKRKSLSARVFHATFFGAVVLGLVTLFIGLGLYTNALIDSYKTNAFGLSRVAARILSRNSDASDFSEEVMAAYRGLSGEERKKTSSPEYRALFAREKDSTKYEDLVLLLGAFCQANGVDDVYVAMYDAERSALVYIADPDPDPEGVFYPGDWEVVEPVEAQRFLNWDGEGILYDISHTERYGWMCTAGVPLRNEGGEIVAFVLTDILLEDLAAGMKNFVLQFTLALLLVTVLVALFQVKRMGRAMVRPLNDIAAAAQKYVEDKRAGEPSTDHFSQLDINTGDEIQNLSEVMADMERDITGFEEDLTRAVAEKERIGTELALASGIQAHLLPNIFPPFPDRDEFDLYATMTPAKEVGGDFYDFFMAGEDHLVMVVADVSGKGIPAALFSMIAKTMLKTRCQARRDPDPQRVLRDVNAALSENNQENMFVTVWLGILEISTGTLTYADAGHEKLLLYQDGAWRYLPKAGGPALAVFSPEDLELLGEKYRYRNQTVTLRPGDAVFQYTDGVTEAKDAQEEFFGEERLLDAMRSAPTVQPDALLPHIQGEIGAFVKDAPQFDDITMFALRMRRVTGEGQAAAEAQSKAAQE